MEKLRHELDRLTTALPDADSFRARLATLVSVYPFNEYEYIIAALLAADKLKYDEYIELRDCVSRPQHVPLHFRDQCAARVR